MTNSRTLTTQIYMENMHTRIGVHGCFILL